MPRIKLQNKFSVTVKTPVGFHNNIGMSPNLENEGEGKQSKVQDMIENARLQVEKLKLDVFSLERL